jgi:hypothetical protein
MCEKGLPGCEITTRLPWNREVCAVRIMQIGAGTFLSHATGLPAVACALHMPHGASLVLALASFGARAL